MKLLSYPDPFLEVVCEEVTDFDGELHHWLDQMKEIMEKNQGMGLAANQVGLKSRMFIMKDLRGAHWEFINPTIIYEEDLQFENEGCLSFNSILVQVKRPKVIRVKAYNRNGEEFNIVAQDKEAICIAHEIEHLNGKTFLDQMTRQQRRDLLRRMKK